MWGLRFIWETFLWLLLGHRIISLFIYEDPLSKKMLKRAIHLFPSSSWECCPGFTLFLAISISKKGSTIKIRLLLWEKIPKNCIFLFHQESSFIGLWFLDFSWKAGVHLLHVLHHFQVYCRRSRWTTSSPTELSSTPKSSWLFFQVSIISDEDCAAQTSSSVKNIKIFKIIKIIKIISYGKSQFFRTNPPRMLCVSSHFWLFTKANLILVSFDKKLWLGHNHPQPPPPLPSKAW